MKRAVVMLIAGTALLAGCSKPAPSAPADPPAAPSSPAHGSLAECLKTHGVQDSGGPAVMMGPPAGVDQATWDKAMTACSTLAPGPASP